MSPIKIDHELSLRLPDVASDAPALFAQLAASRTTIAKWLPWADQITSPEQEATFLRRSKQDRGLLLVITADQRPVGMVSFNRFMNEQREAEVGYWLGNQVTGRGIMHRSLQALCEYGFANYPLEKIWVKVAVDNVASNAVARGAGFQLKTVKPQALELHGRFHDENCWLLQATDFKPKRVSEKG
ncbi:GNAT family N-acetyltransferase [Fructilactobacillus florum]|uniref:Acetyltransferase n=1 Tax=Fructilactobacillus florum DSM 22689 = JCM 16035 TaxID=1423745 RepID=A0A0R2CMH4_9LACO|nr:GNAT family protein [Fructilactobacillus florum]KRM92474.1 acetyltransferase [Fructilactobacillus florum DSM 22689 = JCM 16035]